jgi:signal peptidase I
MNHRRGLHPRFLLAIPVAGLLATMASVAWALRDVRRVEIAGYSMTPALQPGDFVLVRRGAPPPAREYGLIVAVRDPRPDGDGRLLLKRVVGLPGESLRIGGGPVQINGRVLIEPYAHGSGPYEQHRGVNQLAQDEYFLLGDHRGASTDSRDFGPLRRERIEGTAFFRYWPPERFGRLHAPARILGGLTDPIEAARRESGIS